MSRKILPKPEKHLRLAALTARVAVLETAVLALQDAVAQIQANQTAGENLLAVLQSEVNLLKARQPTTFIR